MRLSEMSWKDVADYLETRRSLIIPVGTCEQHGLHLPLATDTLIAEAFAARISEETGVAVAPTVGYGVNLPCDRFVAGTAGFSPEVLRAFVTDLLEDWERQGFRQFFVVTAHGCATDGHSFAHHEALKQGVLPLLAEPPCGDGLCEASILFPYWTDIGDILTGQDGVEHACEAETSLMLFLHPDLVRMDLAADGGEDGDQRFEAFPEGVGTDFPAPGWNGAEGRPSAATAEKGRLILERCLNPMVRYVSEKVGRTVREYP